MKELIGLLDWRNEDYYIPALGSKRVRAVWKQRDEVDGIYEMANAARSVSRYMTRYSASSQDQSFSLDSNFKIVNRSGNLLTIASLGFNKSRFEGPTHTWESESNPDRAKACAELAVKLFEGLIDGEFFVIRN